MIHETERSNNLAQLNETALESILGSIPVGQEVGEGYSLLPTDGLYGKAPLERGRVELLVPWHFIKSRFHCTFLRLETNKRVGLLCAGPGCSKAD